MRFRHDWCSDPCRIMRQQQVLRAMVDRVKNDRINTFLHLGDLMAVFRKYVQTDFTNAELLSLATYFQGMTPAAVVSNQVPYTDDINLPGYGDSLVPEHGRCGRGSSRRCWSLRPLRRRRPTR